ncbi:MULTISPECIES: DUF1173 domain-containing protein [Rhizobium/Agrobacterium group]|uniref:DUF1173 domain-containing protein n=1 Tax=Rhizobium/Agrobacterium group TaxID=227290 RepID=UPI00107F58E0|nr:MULTISPECIES: DUF1173 domain-containing protein [Rhizobium/Agrobacterium group]MBB4402996.1 hypothetical protein [Agrobacterium radiobacter]MBB5589093.1 hypothetical protein [Agrobacterium radiobacter]TGE86062.1 hypothetical protein C9418_24500 [Rhizobium sp. SEMIA 4032]
MRTFKVGDRVLRESSEELRAFLPQAYEQRLRPLCMCKVPPAPMYIARVEDQHLIKRMPLSGRDHDAACPSYEPPYELSGLGPLIGNAIQIDAAGKADLKLDFSLTKRGPRAAAGSSAEASEHGIRSEPRKLSLRAMLHYLWEAGELTEWRSTWKGKRGWGRVRSSLINAASQMSARGGPLIDMLYVPEVFRPDDKDGIAARRAAALKGVQATRSGPRKLMMMVAEVKEFSPAREGQKIVVRHTPFPLTIEDGAWRRLVARYETELELWRSSEAFHLIVIATFCVSAAGIASVEEIALMVVNDHWLPFEDIHELRLLEKLGHLKRKTVKGLRFNLPRDTPIVAVTLPEQKPALVAMFIVPPTAGDDYERALADMIETRPEITPWIWRVADGEIPPLP